MPPPPPIPKLPPTLTTADTIPDAKDCRVLGLVKSTSVRALGIKGGLTPTYKGGEVANVVEFYNGTQAQAEQLMIAQAVSLGANAIVAVRYEITTPSASLYSVLCYGTAVIVRTASK